MRRDWKTANLGAWEFGRQTRTSPRLLIPALSRGRESRLQVSRFRTNMKGDSHGYAAREFPFIGVVGGNGGNARLGARCRSGRKSSEHRTAKRRICPGFLPLVGEYARPGLLAAGIGTRSGVEQGAPEGSGRYLR